MLAWLARIKNNLVPHVLLAWVARIKNNLVPHLLLQLTLLKCQLEPAKPVSG